MKQEVRRGRKFVEYHDPETQDEFTFTQEISGADVSYQDESGNWLAADENWATDGADGFILKNEKLNHKIRLKGKGGRTWYPRRNVNTEYMTFGVPQYRNGNKWSNFSFSGWSVEGKTITLQTRQGVTILVHSRWNGIKIDWVLASSAAPSRMRYPVALTGITEIAGVLFGADGAELGRLTPTTATDANGAELVCSGTFAGGYVEFQADVTGAVYPVVIDPDFSITSTSGDGCLYSIGTRCYWAWESFLEQTRNLIRFDCSSVPAGATTSAANIKVYKYNGAGTPNNGNAAFYEVADANHGWVGTQSGNPAQAGQACLNALAADGSGGVTTAWASGGVFGTAGTDYINTILASYTANRSDNQYTEYTATMNASGIAVVDTWFGSMDGNNGLYLFGWLNNVNLCTSNHATAGYRPTLSVTYTAAATGTLRRTNMNAQMSNLTGGMHG